MGPIRWAIRRARTPIGGIGAPGTRGRFGHTGCAVALRRGAVDPGEEPGAGPLDVDRLAHELGPHLTGELRGHADPVLVLGQVVVGVERRERPSGQEEVLVGGVHQAPAQRVDEPLLPRGHDVDDPLRLRPGVRSHLGLGGVVAHPERHDAHRRRAGEPVEHAEQGVVEHVTVVDAGAHHHLPVHLDAGVEQRREPPEAGGAAPVAQQPGPQLGIGGVDAHVQRAQLLGDDALEIGLGEAGERGEVAVEERQPVVVVLQRQALPHARGQLVDEAERAVVVARAHAVEHRAGEVEPQGHAGVLLDQHQLLEPAAADLELDARLVGLDLVPDDVAHHLAVEREQLVTGEEPGGSRRRAGRDRHHTGGRHRSSLREGVRYPTSRITGSHGR